MSVTGDQLDGLESIATGAIAGLTVSRTPGMSHDLPTSEIPHAFLHTPAATVTLLEWGQEQVSRTVQLDLVFRDTQDNALLALEALRTALRADPTASPRALPDATERAWVSAWVVGEHEQEPGDVLIECVVTLETVE